MIIIQPSATVEWIESSAEIMLRLERCGRTAYKSEDKITEGSATKFIQMIIRRSHLSVLEHVAVSARVICCRGVSHEIVRHRIASYTQESTRYCNYGEHDDGVTFIAPSFLEDAEKPAISYWYIAMEDAERAYLGLLRLGRIPQEARSVLPNSLKTEIVMTMNLREWLHFFKLRTSSAAHPDMRIVAKLLQTEFQLHLPVIFTKEDQDES